MLAMSKLAALAAAGDSLTGAAALKADALRVRDRRLAMMAVQARAPPRIASCICAQQGMLTCTAWEPSGDASALQSGVLDACLMHCVCVYTEQPPAVSDHKSSSALMPHLHCISCRSWPLVWFCPGVLKGWSTCRSRWGCPRRRATLRTSSPPHWRKAARWQTACWPSRCSPCRGQPGQQSRGAARVEVAAAACIMKLNPRSRRRPPNPKFGMRTVAQVTTHPPDT